MRSVQDTKYILNGVTGTGAGSAMLVEDFRFLILALDTADSANCTIKVQGSISHDEPNWAASQAHDNQWDYVQIHDYEDASAIDGDTGIALAGTDDHRLFHVNTDGLRWLNVIVTTRSAGTIYAQVKAFN